MLMRFDYPLSDGKSLVLHHGHRIRKELIDYYEHNRLNGSDLGLRSTKVRPPGPAPAAHRPCRPDSAGARSACRRSGAVCRRAACLKTPAPRAQQTEDDMRHSVFCVCPPGNTQDSARVWRAIILGCIPVTFFRANDLPFGRHMGMPYRDFVLNIQPDDYHQLNKRVRHLLNSPARLRRMQEARRPCGPDACAHGSRTLLIHRAGPGSRMCRGGCVLLERMHCLHAARKACQVR